MGKTSLAEMVGLLAGGVVSFTKEESPEVIMKRLISSSALDKRVVLFDNVKTLKFSSEVLEGLLTASAVSGWKLYRGNGSRPNTLTYLMTINGASLSKDMAQRCVIVKVRRPSHSGDWAEQTRGFIEKNRWAIIGDILAELRREAPPLECHSRWGHWESGVLAQCDNPSNCQRLIEERQGEVDGDQDEADQVREVFVEDLKMRGYDPERCVVWYPASMAAMLVNHATGEQKATNKANSYLNNLAIKEIMRQKAESQRGYLWRGSEAPPEAERVKYDSTGKREVVC